MDDIGAGNVGRVSGARPDERRDLLNEAPAELASDALDAARSHHAALAGLRAQVEAAQPVLAELAAREQAARSAAHRARGWAERLRATTVPEAAQNFIEQHRQAYDAAIAAQEDLARATAAREAAEHFRLPLPDLPLLRAVRAAHDTLAACTDGIIDVGVRMQALATAESSQRAEMDAAEAAVRGATGDREAFSRLQRDHAETTRQLAAATQELATRQQQRAELTAQVSVHPDVVSLDALIEIVVAAEAAMADARGNELAAADREWAADAGLQAMTEVGTHASRQYIAQREAVAALDPPPAVRGVAFADWRDLTAWAAATAPAQDEAATAAEVASDGLAKDRADRLGALRDAARSLGVTVDPAADAECLLAAVAAAQNPDVS